MTELNRFKSRVAPWALRLFAPLLAAACLSEGSEEMDLPTQPPATNGGEDESGMETVGDDGSDSSSEGSGSSDEGGSSDSGGGPDSSGTDDGALLSCDDLDCKGHGHCEETELGPVCICDEHYILNDVGDECVVDESCVEFRFLEDRCRQIFNGPPAVGLFFSVDFCAGTAVTPEKLEELNLEFKVLENDTDIVENVESYATVLDKDVESFVSLVVDVSDSITMSEDLPFLVEVLQQFVSDLEAADEMVYMELYVFGRNVERLVSLTEDLGKIDQALSDLSNNPTSVVNLVGGMGTSLYQAVGKGIDRVQRARDLRAAVTHDGVLSTGTVVVVTDGKDTSNGDLDEGQIKNTLNQVIAIGISDDIEESELQAIGRDGAFKAPSVEDWDDAFAEITQRVDEYPDRSYLLTYCSSATEAEPEVTISLKETVPALTATCRFDADLFSSTPMVCNAATFAGECAGRECGGLTGCGACSDDACCVSGGSCAAPGEASDCDDEDALCEDGEICVKVGEGQDAYFECQTPPILGTPCTKGDSCDPGVTWCSVPENESEGFCVPVFSMGAVCEVPEQCPELNCSRKNPDNIFESTTCRDGALIAEACGKVGPCERGSYCQGGKCVPKKRGAHSCSGHMECRSSNCNDEDPKVCLGSNVCLWSWSRVAQ